MTRRKRQRKIIPFSIRWLVTGILCVFNMLATALPTYTNLHKFTGPDGAIPDYPNVLAQGQDGNLYGTTISGGLFAGGTAFKITPGGAFTKLHDFNSTKEGFAPRGGLILGKDGNFYGTTYSGGTHSIGTFFKMTSTGIITVLHNFGDSNFEGHSPYAPPIQGRDGNFYGTASNGGNPANSGRGTIYKVTPTGAYSVLYDFDQLHGANPVAPLIEGKDGNFYGTTVDGGKNNWGTVFRITASGNLSVLYNFDATHGAKPIGPLLAGKDGNFYGTTLIGGTSGSGIIFKITPAGALSTLRSFSATLQGYQPWAGLVQSSDGNFYGAASGGNRNCGVLFKLTQAGVYSIQHNFQPSAGCNPHATPILHTDGKVYGMSLGSIGSIYRLDVGAPSFVSANPSAAKAGAAIGILGNLTNARGIKLNGVSTTLSGTANTFRVATVPAGPATGLITVTKTTGALNSNKLFYVLPTFTNFTPLSGRAGNAVTINGKSLSQTTAVYFTAISGLIKVTPTVNNDSRLTAFVPVGAKTGRIFVSTKGGSAASATNFTVTQ